MCIPKFQSELISAIETASQKDPETGTGKLRPTRHPSDSSSRFHALGIGDSAMQSRSVKSSVRPEPAIGQLVSIGPGMILSALVLMSLLIQLRFVLVSDFRFLATNWIQDDSFYYFQPAWLFKDTRMFTFDGETPTYGFQPLWMLVLVGLASARELFIGIDKVSFLRLALVLQSVLFCATGVMLYQLGRRWGWHYLALVAPMLWLINPGLIEIFTTGKENTLYAFLLVLAMILTFDCLHTKRFPWTHVGLGVVLGLLILARVNSLIAVMFFMATTFLLSKQNWPRRFLQTGVQLMGIALVALPWFLYANWAFGTVMPNSGTRKLIGAQAAFLQYLHTNVPQVPLQWLEGLVSVRERIFFDHPAQLSLPSLSALAEYTLEYLPHISGAFWVDNLLLRFPNTYTDLLRAIFTATLLVVIAAAIWSLRTRQSGALALDTTRKYAPYFTLLAFAAINSVLNGFLFPAYLRYATWYAVPETLAIVISVPMVIRAWVGRGTVASHHIAVFLVFLGLILSPGFLLSSHMSPKSFEDIRARFLPSAWETINWMNHNLPADARVGSWSSGLLGYFSQGPTIINLDGLANSPDYVEEVVYYDVIDQQGLGSQPLSNRVLYRYLQSHGIGWLADADFEANLGAEPFFRAIPAQDYEVIWLGTQSIDWHEPEGPRRWAVVKLALEPPPEAP